MNGVPVSLPSQRASNGVLYGGRRHEQPVPLRAPLDVSLLPFCAVLDEPLVTPGMVLRSQQSPAWDNPRNDAVCQALLLATQQACAGQMCGSCHSAICAAGDAVGCQFKARSDRRVLTAGPGLPRVPYLRKAFAKSSR